jgi:hypothetical protein
MTTHSNQFALHFPDLISRRIVVQADAPHVTSDGGGILLGQLDASFGYTQRFAACFTDGRDPDWVEHSLLTMLRQRVYAIGLGYEDLNDHDQLRGDPLLAAVCGHEDPGGTQRRYERDQGKPLAGKSTLNRLELKAQSETDQRYKKIVAKPEAIEDFFITEFVRSLDKKTRRVVLDLDLTEDPLYGQQEGRFFHGYYDSYCYLPLYIFCGDWPVVARLRTADQDHAEDTLRTVAKVIAALRAKFPRLGIVLRGDSGFCRDELMKWCEANGVQYLLGLARNPVLQRILRGSLRSAKSMLDYNQSQAERVFKDFRYRAKSWGKNKRRVVGKAEWTQEGPNPRFIISNIPAEEIAAQDLYEREYCGRGEMENRIKEQHLDLRADRTSTHWLASNQLRLWFSTLAYLLINQLRQRALAGTELAQATCGTIRLKLMKIGAVVKVSVRRVLVSLSTHHPMKELWFAVARNLLTLDTG